MKKGIFKLTALALACTLFIVACKEKFGPNPTLRFVTENGYTYADDSVAIGESVLIGLKCNWNGNDLLTGINVNINGVKDEEKSLEFKEGMEALGISFNIVKDVIYEENISFELLDASGNIATSSLLLTIDSTKLSFKDFENINLGAQNNTTPNGFYSSSKNKAYVPTDTLVTKNYVTIDFIFAYDDTNKAIIGSPKSDWAGIFDLSSWGKLNETTFAKTVLKEKEYLLLTKTQIVSYYTAAKPVNKVVGIAANDYYVFKTSTSKYGMIKVKSVIAGANGSISLDLKIEK